MVVLVHFVWLLLVYSPVLINRIIKYLHIITIKWLINMIKYLIYRKYWLFSLTNN